MDKARREERRRIDTHTIPLKLQAPPKPLMECPHRERLLHSSSTASRAVLVLEVNLEAHKEPPKCKARASLVRLSTQPTALAPLLARPASARASRRHQFLPAAPREYHPMICPVYRPHEMRFNSTILRTYTPPLNDMCHPLRQSLSSLTIRVTRLRNTHDSHSTIFLRPRMLCKLQVYPLGSCCSL